MFKSIRDQSGEIFSRTSSTGKNMGPGFLSRESLGVFTKSKSTDRQGFVTGLGNLDDV